MRFGKIIATLGPSIFNKTLLAKIDKFVDVYRINLSHADLISTRKLIKEIREINSHKVFLLDTKGPEIRTTNSKEIECKLGDEIIILSKPLLGQLSFDYEFFSEIPLGTKIIFDDNVVVGEVIENTGKLIKIKILQEGIVGKNKTVNFQGYEPRLDFFTEKDRQDIDFGIQEGIKCIAVSFVKSANDIIYLRNFIKEKYKEEVKLIAKIETKSAVEDIDRIIEVSDGIMIARGDLGATIDLVKLPQIQLDIVKKCNLAGKLVILATQVMSTMSYNFVPTRAEVDEVAFNLLNGVDVFMLSNETAVGKYPLNTLAFLDKLIRFYQNNVKLKFQWEELKWKNYNDNLSYVLYSAKKIVSKLGVKEVVIATNDSNIVSYLSTLKFTVPINVITSDNLLYKWANFLYSTRAFYVDDENMQYSKLKGTIAEILKKQANGKLKSSDKILIIYPLINNTSTVIHNGMELVSFLDL